jgi:predicted small integral membrane protein
MATTTTRSHEARGWLALGTLPVAVTVVVAINGSYMALVAIGNITDFGTNQEFVQHVLAMDTTDFGAEGDAGLDPDVMWRAVTNETLQLIAYIGVIIWETLTAVVCLAAVWLWVRARHTRSFDLPRRVATIGMLMIIILFFGGFITVGGEWFQMWRSVEWNGLDPAFRNSVLALFALVLIHLPSPQWNAMADDDTEGMLAR